MKPIAFSINYQDSTAPLPIFWNSTGFTPATLMLTKDMQQQIAYFGSIQRQGLRFARIHYLLELLEVTFEGPAAVAYDWSRLDTAIDWLVQCGMAPIFELMGNPDGQFTSFQDDLQLNRWENMVHDLAVHLMERYGRREVESWYFESWNEPDIGWWHEFPHDEAAFCSYYDACASGIKRADPGLRIGGPGSCRTLSSLFCSFLEHCDRGTNYFTSQTGTALDFISIHEKAAPARKENISPDTAALIDREIKILAYIRNNHPKFANLPFMNNECDPQVGWKDHHTWRASSYYAAWMVKSVDQHLTRLIDGNKCNYAVLSNDNGFVGEWGHRTLLTRFGPSNWIEDGQSGHEKQQAWKQRDFSTPEFSLIKKPAFSAQTLLSFLGKERLPLSVDSSPDHFADDTFIGCIPTREDNTITLLVYHSQDRLFTSGNSSVKINLENFPFSTARVHHFRIDHHHNNPFQVWETSGAPLSPSRSLIHQMRQVQEPILLSPGRSIDVSRNRIQISFQLPLHAVSLITITPPSKLPTPVIENMERIDYPGLHGAPDSLLRWESPNARGIIFYDVLFSKIKDGPFVPSGHPRLSTTSVMLTAQGYYRVRAVNCQGDPGTISPVVHFSTS